MDGDSAIGYDTGLRWLVRTLAGHRKFLTITPCTDRPMVTNGVQFRNGVPGHAGKRKSGKRDKKSGEMHPAAPAADDGGSIGRDGDRRDDASAAPRSDASRAPAKVGGAAASRRIRAIGDVSESLDVRRRLRRLARQVERRSRNVQHMTLVEGAIADCLDDAASAVDRERWLLCEAATWGLAWMARTRRAGGSAGSLLERLVQAARVAQPPLAAGDTLPARFVLTVARLFCDIEACRSLDRDATDSLAAEIRRLVSAEGTVSLHTSASMVERVVRWSSARDVAIATGAAPWDAPTEKLFMKAVATSLRLLGGDGRLLVGAGRLPGAFSDPMLVAAAESRRKRVRHTAEFVQESAHKRGVRGRTPARGKRDKKRDVHERLLSRDLHDAAAAVAIIRSGWEPNAIRVMVGYRDTVPHLEIAVGDRLLVDGPWAWKASQGDHSLELEGPWSLSCWESDKKGTYLEIIAPLAGGMQIDRQIVLLPKDRVLLLADAVTQRPPERVEDAVAVSIPHTVGGLRLESLVPLAPTLEGESAEETREILVYDTKPRFMALPLSLPEWKNAGRGSFTVTPEGLALDHHAAGSRCCSPIWIDLDPARQGRPLTWRQLTVADTRQNLPPQQAVGFRVQEGLEQWLVYRTLDEPRNRTVLGCNISCGFLMGRIGRTGVVDRLIEIQ